MHLTLDDFDPAFERLGFLGIDVTSGSTDLVDVGELWIVQYEVEDSTALLAGGVENG